MPDRALAANISQQDSLYPHIPPGSSGYGGGRRSQATEADRPLHHAEISQGETLFGSRYEERWLYSQSTAISDQTCNIMT